MTKFGKWLRGFFAKKAKVLNQEEVSKVLQQKHPLYGLGSADPLFFASGIDTQVWFNGKRVTLAQSISLNKNNLTGYFHGQLVFVGTPGNSMIKELLDTKKGYLLVKAASEYGHEEVCFEGEVEFEHMHWGISIDDIISETTVLFTNVRKDDQDGSQEEER